MAYLGRISAVLTASTRDFTREIGTARRELQNFAQQARGVQFNLDNRALNGTLTNLQRFRRTLEEIQRLQAAGVGAGLPNVRRLRDQFRAFEDIGRPLTDVKNRIEGLSNSIQTELYPELEKIQSGFRNFYRQLGEGSATFDGSAARIDNLRQRLVALSRATAALSDLGSLTRQLNANNTGASFITPRSRDALQESIALRGQAQSLPGRFRGGAFADLAVQAEENSERIERAAARVARAQLRIVSEGENPRTLGQRGRAQAELDALTRQQNAINLSFRREIASAQIREVISPEAPRQVDSLVARIQSLSSELRALDSQRFNGLITNAASVVEQFNRGEVSARRARQEVERLAAVLGNANIGRALQDQTRNLLFTQREQRQQQIQSNFDRSVANIPAGDPRRRRAELERDINLQRDALNEDIIPRTQRLAASATESNDQGAIRSAQQVLQLNRQINNELIRAANLAENNNYDEAMASLVRVNDLLRRQQTLEEGVADRIQTSNAARRQSELFLQASGGTSEQLSQGARDAASDISVARQFRGQIASGASRIQIQQEIDRTTVSANRLQQQMAEVAASGIGANRMAAELDRLDNEIRQTTQGLARFIAVRSNGAFSERQIEASMERARNTAGSITARGANTFQLAMQQALFAVDDLISSTGGLEYKLRAVGNNITQLGLLLGQSGVIPGISATTGLMIGLGVVVGGQVVSAFLRYVTGAKEAEDASKSLSKSIERQASLLAQINNGYDQIGSKLGDSGFSKAAKAAEDFAAALRNVVEQQRQLNDERLLMSDPAAFAAGRRNVSIDQRKENASLPGEAIAFQRLRSDNVRISELAADRLRTQGAPNGEQLRATLAGVAVRLRNTQSRIGGFEGTAEAIASGNTTGRALLGYNDSAGRAAVELLAAAQRAEQASRTIPVGGSKEDVAAQRAAIDGIINTLKDKATQRAFGFLTTAATEAANTIEQLQQELTRLEGDSGLVEYFQVLSSASRDLSQAQEAATAALERGVPSSGELSSKIDAVSKEIADSRERIRKENERLERLGPGANNADVERRNAAVKAENERILDAQNRAEGLLKQSDELSRRRGFGGRRLTDATTQLEQNQSLRNGFANTIALLQRRAQDEAIARRNLDRATEDRVAGRGTQAKEDAARAELERIQRSNEALALFAENITSASNSLKDLRDVLEGSVQESQQRVNELQRELNDNKPENLGGRPRERVRRERDEAIANRIEDERRARVLNANLAARESQLANSDQVVGINEQLNAIDARRKQLEEEIQKSGNAANTGRTLELQQLQIKEAELLAERERIYREGTQAERDAIDAQARVVRERQQLAESVARGRELTATPEQKAARDFGQAISDIRANADKELRAGNRNAQGEANKAINREFLERARQVAPALMGFRDERLNAMLQGPSRQALNVSDVQTMEGQRELNRLLRGDDPAKDVNLQELREQTRLLDGLLNEAKNRNVQIELRG